MKVITVILLLIMLIWQNLDKDQLYIKYGFGINNKKV